MEKLGDGIKLISPEAQRDWINQNVTSFSIIAENMFSEESISKADCQLVLTAVVLFYYFIWLFLLFVFFCVVLIPGILHSTL